MTITNQGTGVKVETRTNTEGAFSMTGLSSGTYEVTITKEGFNTYTERDIFVGPTVVRSVNAIVNGRLGFDSRNSRGLGRAGSNHHFDSFELRGSAAGRRSCR